MRNDGGIAAGGGCQQVPKHHSPKCVVVVGHNNTIRAMCVCNKETLHKPFTASCYCCSCCCSCRVNISSSYAGDCCLGATRLKLLPSCKKWPRQRHHHHRQAKPTHNGLHHHVFAACCCCSCSAVVEVDIQRHTHQQQQPCNTHIPLVRHKRQQRGLPVDVVPIVALLLGDFWGCCIVAGRVGRLAPGSSSSSRGQDKNAIRVCVQSVSQVVEGAGEMTKDAGRGVAINASRGFPHGWIPAWSAATESCPLI